MILPKMGVDKTYNKTTFKTESVITRIMFLDIKKNYAYKEIAKKGKVYKEAKIKYTGIPVVRSDYSKFAQDFIRKLIEDMALNDELSTSDKMEMLTALAEERFTKLQTCIEEFDFKYIATPGKWGGRVYTKDPFTIVGMKLYNTMVDTEVFMNGSDGLSFPILIKQPGKFLDLINKNKDRSELFLNNTDIDNINYVVVPSNYEVDILKPLFQKYFIEIDSNKLWDKNFSKIAKDIVEVIKNS